ncbi:target of Nesh-SH3 isoform X3 [Simochromis diagramma]|uniref:target of Nesh-SH3 isoform X3 n=1 Tax=Simochromis diagramma TaxID=43689 RepID=UPI001A7E47D7|nr:target of Nesh-SH3 isoform X3 [Simochromis diagramma]
MMKMQQHSHIFLALILAVFIFRIALSGPSVVRVRRQNMKVRISTTGDTIVMKFLRPNTDTRLEGYILGYGGSMFSKQFIQLPEDGKPYETEFDAEPKYLIAVQPIPANEVKKQCTGKVELQKPLHLVIGSVTPTSVLLSWGTLLKTPYEGNVMNDCLEDGHYTVRYREKNRKWNYQTCPTSDTVIDKLKPNTVYEFGVQPNSKDGTGVWSRPVVHNISMPGVEEKVIRKIFRPPVSPAKPVPSGPHSLPSFPHLTSSVQNKTRGRLPLSRNIATQTTLAPTTTTTKTSTTTKETLSTPGPAPAVINKQPIGGGDLSRSEVPLTPKLHPLLHITTTMAPVPVVQANVENHGGHVQPQPNLKLQQQYSGLPKPKPQQPQMKPRVNAQRLPKPHDQTVTQPHTTPQIKVQTTSKLHITPQSIIQIQPQPHTTPQSKIQMKPQPHTTPQLKVQTKLQLHTTPQSKIQMKPQPHTTLQQKVPIQLQPHTTARTKLHAQPKPLSTAQPIFQTKPQLQIQTTFQPKLHTQPQQHLAVSQPTEHTHPLSLPQTKPKPQSHLQTTPHLESEPQPQSTPYTKHQAQPLAQEEHKTQTQPQRQDQLSSQTTPVPSIQSTYPIPQHIPYTKKRPLKTQTQPQPHPQNKSPNPPHKPKTPQQQPGVSTRRKSGIQPASKPSIISSHSRPSTQPEPKNQTKPQPLSQPKRQPKLHPSTQLPKSHSKPIIRDKQNSPPKILPQLKSQPPKNTQDHVVPQPITKPQFPSKAQSQPQLPSKPQPKPQAGLQPHSRTYSDPTKVTSKQAVPTAPSPQEEGKPLPRPALATEKAGRYNHGPGVLGSSEVPRSPISSSVPTAGRNTTLRRTGVPSHSTNHVARPFSQSRTVTSSHSSSTPGAASGAHHRGNALPRRIVWPKEKSVQRPSVSGNKKTNLVAKPSSHDKPMDLKQGEKASVLKPFPLVTARPKQEPKQQTTTTAPALNTSRFDIYENSSIFRPLPKSEVDSMGNPRFIAPHVIYKTDKPPEEPCSITSSLAYFPDEEGSDQNVTGPPRLPPSNVTVVTVEGCPSFVILDWQKTDNETREYEVVSTTTGPNGRQTSVLTTNQTHTAVENLKPESSYEFTVTPRNELGTGPSSDPVTFSTESADPRVSEYVSGKDAIWTQFPFKADAHSECNGKQFVKRTWYRKFVGIQLCNSLRYKIYLSETLNGKFYNIGDQTGYGEDHCQFVDSFLDGKTGSHFLADQLPSRQGFYRALRQEPVSFGEIGGKSHATYVGWYECGTPIPGKW